MRKKFSLILVFSLMLTMFIFPHKSTYAKEYSQEDFYSKFTSIIREYDNNFEDVIIEKDSLTKVNDTYMISDKQFTTITGDKISYEDNIYSIYNDENNVQLNIENNTFITDYQIIDSDENFIKTDDSLLIPIEELAINLGYELSPTKDGYILSRTFASKRLIIDCDGEINLLDSVAYASHNNLHIIQFDNEQSTKNAFNYYSAIDNIDGVAVDMVVGIADSEEDSSQYNSWGGDYIGIDDYLAKIDTNSLQEVVVAVIDTGVDHDHYLLTDRLIDGDDYGGNGGVNLSDEEDLDSDYPYEDGHKHGTHVSGIITDLTPSNVKILPIRSLNSEGKAAISSIIAGIELCIDYKNDTENPMNIVAINMSLGGTSPIGTEEYTDYSTWINNALDNEILSIVAAGNETQDCINVSPANVQNAITVSALKIENNNLVFDASYSNYGSYIDICAPGTSILSGVLNNETAYLSGTSMATPHVSAMVALLLSNSDTQFNCEEVQASILATAIDLGVAGKDTLYGYGCVNIAQGYAKVIDNVVFSDTTLYHQDEFELTLSCETSNSVIYYTLDGSTPDKDNGILYNSSPITITDSCKVSAIAYTFSENDIITGISPISFQNYSFDGITPESYFTITDEGVITSYTGGFTLVGVPETINGIIPVAIDDEVFVGSTLEEISIPDSVKTIGSFAFYNCTNLKKVTADGVTTIDSYAFYGNTYLESISFNSVETIDIYAFYLCKNIVTIDFPNVKNIKMCAFDMSIDDAQLTTVNIPQATTIASGAFYNATNLTSITMPNVEIISSYAFFNCKSLTSINTPNLKYIGNSAFLKSSITDINIPVAQTIGIKAFYNCSNLQSVTISKYIELIGDDAFEGCNIQLKFNIYEGNDYLFEYLQNHYHLFTTLNSSTNLDYTLSNNEITITGYSYTDNEIIIPEYIDDYPVTAIADNVFKNSSKIKSLNSTTLKSIGNETFYDCSNLQSIYIPNIEDIGSKAFYNCPNLISADIINVKNIKSEAFVNTPNIVKLTFNENITTIEDYAIGYNYDSDYTLNESFRIFYKYSSSNEIPDILTTYSTTNNIKVISYNERQYSFYYQLVYNNTTGTTTAWITYFEDFVTGEISIPSQLTLSGETYDVSTINSSAFEDCAFLEKITLPSTVTAIGSYAFADCISLKSIKLEKVVDFGIGAFENCLSLQEASLEATQVIPNYLFYNCKSLTSVNIPIVNTIGISAFENCYELKTITFTAQHLKTIHSRAFYNNYKLELTNLNYVTTLGTQTSSVPIQYDGEIFVNCLAMNKVYLNNIVNMGENLFTGSNITKVYIGNKLANITNSITDTDGITIYGYSDTTAEYYANNYKTNYSAENNIPFVYLQSLSITTNLPSEKIRVQQNNELYLTFEGTGSDLTYYFYETNSSHSQSTLKSKDVNIVEIDTSTIGLYYYYFIVKNWDEQTLTSNYVTIEVLETSQSYVVNIETDGNGNVSPSGRIIVAVGERKYFTITPNTNFRLYKLTINGEDKTSSVTNNTFSIYNLYSDTTLDIYVEFEVDEFDINMTSSGNGNSSDSSTYLRGEDITLTFIANDHYHISLLKINNQSLDEAIGLKEHSYIISSIDKDYDIQIEYSIDTYTLTISKSGHGELSISGSIIASYGSSKTIEFFPSDGYKVGKVTLDNNVINYTQNYTFNNISADHTLYIEFVERKYNITLSSDDSAGNVIINGSSENLDYGESRILTIIPKEGYLIDKVYVNDEVVNVVDNEVIITNIDDDLKVEVKYKKDLNVTITKPITDFTSSPYAVYIIITIVAVIFLTLFLSLIFRKKRI